MANACTTWELAEGTYVSKLHRLQPAPQCSLRHYKFSKGQAGPPFANDFQP
jgi:hypothetical protein